MNASMRITPWRLPVQGHLTTPAIIAVGTAGGLGPAAVRRYLGHRYPIVSSAFDSKDTTSIAAAVDKLRSGASVIIFPEDQPVDEDVVSRGRPDVAALAVATGTPIIPVALRHQVHSRSKTRSTDSVLVIGDQIDVTRDRDLLEYHDRLEGWILREIVDRVMLAIASAGGRRYVDDYEKSRASRPTLSVRAWIEQINAYREHVRDEREQAWQRAEEEAELASQLDDIAQQEWDRAEQAAKRYAAQAAALDQLLSERDKE